MKKLFTLLAIAAVASPMGAQDLQYTYDNANGFDMGGGMEIDINNDGYLDLVLGGRADGDKGRTVTLEDGTTRQVNHETWQMVWNPTTKSYDESFFPQVLGERIFSKAVDYNGDGLMDYITVSSANEQFYTAKGIYLNDGKGGFTQQAFTAQDADGNDYTFASSAIDVADFNNDGLVDIVGIGNTPVNGVQVYTNSVLINQGNNKFVAVATDLISAKVGLPTVMATDLNNDGYADFVICGNADQSSGSANEPDRYFNAYLNLGEEGLEAGLPSFYSLDLPDQDIYQIGYGAIQCADYNNDGIMDIFATGENPKIAMQLGAAGEWGWVPQVLMGTGEGQFVRQTQTIMSAHLNPLNSSSTAIRSVDVDGDGNMDILVPGWCQKTPTGGDTGAQTGYVYLNANGNGVISSAVEVPAGSEANVFVVENGVTGKRDFVTSGFTGNTKWVKEGHRYKINITNPFAAAARPDVPTGLKASVDKDKVTLSWEAPASAKKNATYEYYIKNKETGKLYNFVGSFIGGELDGVRKLIAAGNAYLNKTMTLHNLTNGTYEWGVQTINAAYNGSKFATGEFTVSGGSGVEEFKAVDVLVSTVGNAIEVKAGENAEVSVYALSGAQVAAKSFAGVARIEVPTGAYIVKVATEQGTKVQKVIL